MLLVGRSYRFNSFAGHEGGWLASIGRHLNEASHQDHNLFPQIDAATPQISAYCGRDDLYTVSIAAEAGVGVKSLN
jgi:hypothetical protein